MRVRKLAIKTVVVVETKKIKPNVGLGYFLSCLIIDKYLLNILISTLFMSEL